MCVDRKILMRFESRRDGMFEHDSMDSAIRHAAPLGLQMRDEAFFATNIALLRSYTHQRMLFNGFVNKL